MVMMNTMMSVMAMRLMVMNMMERTNMMTDMMRMRILMVMGRMV